MPSKKVNPQRRLEVAYIDGFGLTRMAPARWKASVKDGLSEEHFTYGDTRAAFQNVRKLFVENPAWIDYREIDTLKLADACAGVDSAEIELLIKDRNANGVNFEVTVTRLKAEHDKRTITQGLKSALVGVANAGDAGTALLLAKQTLDRIGVEIGADTLTAGNNLTPLADLADPTPEADNPAALFKGGWLRKGGGAVLVSLAGQGKSTWTIQAAACWAMGKPAFGIAPARALNIAIVQSEDDAEEVAFFRNQIAEGLATEGGLDPAEIGAAMSKRVMLSDMTGATGAAFVDRLGKLLKAHPETDLVIINPLQAFFGGNISDNASLTEFLRAGLDPLIKPSRAGVLFVHHTNKPPNSKERGGWGTDAFAAYVGAGGAELTNWARAMLALMPVENLPGVFRLVAGKRGQRLGWTDSEGVKTNTRLIAHHDRLIYWRDVTEAEAGAVQGAGGKSDRYGDPKADADTLAIQAQGKPWKLTDLRAYAGQLIGNARGRRAFDHLLANAAGYRLATATAKWKGTTFIGTRPEAEQAAAALDTSKTKAGL